MGGEGTIARPLGGRAMLLACAMVTSIFLALFLWSASADAAVNHPFLGTLAKNVKKGFGEGVCGVSVDPATGEAHVSDPAGGASAEPLIEVFDEAGTFLRKFKGTATPAAGFEAFCSTAENDKNGIVYVADGGGHAVYPFNREGKFEGKRTEEGKAKGKFETITGSETPAGEFSEALNIAVEQSSGRLYVSDLENRAVDIFNEAGKYEGQLAFPGGPANEHFPGPVAVDQKTGEVYVAVEGQAFTEETNFSLGFVYAFDSSGKFLRQVGGRQAGQFPGFGSEAEPLLTGLAIGPEGNVYVSDAVRRAVFEFDAAGNFIGEITGTPSERFNEPFGVALNSAGRLYVVDRTEERNAAESERTGGEAQPLRGRVDIFGPSAAGLPNAKPTVESESSSNIGVNSATLNAEVDPTGVETSYYFELCANGSCRDLPAAPGASIGHGEARVAVSQTAQGLQANTTYTYSVVLTFGQGETVTGAPQTFTTRTEGADVELPDGRGWELVSPPEKNGAGLEAIAKEGGLIQSSEDGNALTYLSLAPPDRNPEGSRAPTFSQLLAKRSSDSSGAPQWKSQDITLPGEQAEGARTQGKQEYRFFSSDLLLSLVEPPGLRPQAEPPLSSEATERTIYTRASEGCTPAPSVCYVPLVTSKTDTAGTHFGGGEGAENGVQFVNASPDLSHVVLESKVPLTTEAANPTSSNIYEWVGKRPNGELVAPTEQLHLVNVLPKKTPEEAAQPAAEARLGFSFMKRNSVSTDGSRVIFTSKNHLYVRDTVKGETTQVDKPEVENGEEKRPKFQTASTDGSRIFFTDEARLTEKSKALPSVPDLYEFDMNAQKKVTDLTINPRFAETHERASVGGLVPGASEDGSTVYFVANGVLTTTPNARGERAAPGRCITTAEEASALPSGATCNLYMQRNAQEGQPPTFVANLSAEDAPDWQNNNANLEYVTSRVSPDGRYFAFMSNRRLTGYDNRDTNPAAHEAADEEVFLYDSAAEAGKGGIVCPSCATNGTRPFGVFDAGSLGRSEEGIGLLIDRIQAWEGKWLAGALPGWTGSEGQTALYQSRYLSSSGRLFFNTTARLAQADKNTQNDVYEYQPSGAAGCQSAGGCTGLISSGSSTHESAFLDASVSANDVFFLTASALVSTDHDADFDVYDARVCAPGGCVTSPPPPPTSCNSAEECRTTHTSVPSFGSPASSTTPSSGNAGPQFGVLPIKTVVKPVAKLTRGQRLAKALKACKKLKKNKRQVCEKTARKNYGPTKKAKKKSSKGRK